MIRYRDQLAREWGLNLIYGQNGRRSRKGAPFRLAPSTGSRAARLLKTQALQHTLSGQWPRYRFNHASGGYDLDPNREPFTGVIAGVRADEEGSRSKERYFSPRSTENVWDVGDQPPEFWNQYKTEFAPGTHVRIHPLLDWTELNIWEYISREEIPTVSLYYDQGNGTRYRSLGCYPCTRPVAVDCPERRKRSSRSSGPAGSPGSRNGPAGPRIRTMGAGSRRSGGMGTCEVRLNLVQVHSRLYTGCAYPLSFRIPKYLFAPAISPAMTPSMETRSRMPQPWSAPFPVSLILGLTFALSLVPRTGFAQGTGTITGTVTRSGEGSPLPSVSVSVQSGQNNVTTVTGPDGRYTLRRVPEGPQTVVFKWLGYRPMEKPVTVAAEGTTTVDAALEPVVLALTELVVSAASRAPERIVEAPAAISVIEPQVLQNTSITGQAPLALATAPGVDVVQSGVNDFNINARGFNSSLNRRMLVLQDGRDLSIAFLGAQEWNGMVQPLEDLGRMEVVRGPGSALYGANAFSGVVNIITPEAREVAGTKLTLAGGELETFRGDLRPGRRVRRRPLRLSLQRRVQPERHLLPLPDPQRRHLAAAGIRPRHRRAGRADPGADPAQRPDERPRHRCAVGRPEPTQERLRLGPAGLLPQQRLGALRRRRRGPGHRTRCS